MITNIYNYPFPLINLDNEYTLREQRLEDAEAFLEYYADPDVSQYILTKTPTSLKEAADEIECCRRLFQYRQGIYWAIAQKSTDRMIGAVGLYINNHHHRAEICYDLHKSFWKQGIMSRAMIKVMNHMFRYAGLHRIEAITVKENIPSIQILKKLGFEFEGSLKNYRYFNNKPHDIELFALTKSMFQNTHKKI